MKQISGINLISRTYLGVHWIFDATGGEIVGKAVVDKVVVAFQETSTKHIRS